MLYLSIGAAIVTIAVLIKFFGESLNKAFDKFENAIYKIAKKIF